MNDNHFPEYVKFYPVMAIQAARRASRVGGGYRLYVLAKALDQEGRGAIPRDMLREYALSLGVSPRQWLRWIDQARTFGLVRDVQRKSGEWELILPGAATAAEAMNCENLGGRQPIMKASHLIGKGWKARIWAAYLTIHNGKPISRERLQKIVNVPVLTQRHREAQAGVIRQQNHAKLKARADALPMMQDYGRHKGLYIRRDGYLGARKPDSRFTDLAERGRKGRARKANATLHRIQRQRSLSQMRRALNDDADPGATNHSVYVRLFNSTPDERRASERKLSEGDFPQIREIYELSHVSEKGVNVWLQC